MVENWKPVPGFEGLYEVSDLGNIKSVERFIERKGKHGGQLIHEKMKKFKKNNKGYYMVNLHKNGYSRLVTVHRIVAQAFVPNENPDIYTVVNHIDENPLNNTASNLEWCTMKHNLNHRTCPERIRKSLEKGGYIHPVHVIVFPESGDPIGFPSIKSAARWLNINHNILLKMRKEDKAPHKINGHQIRFDGQDGFKADIWAAFAVAVTYHDKYMKDNE